ncbi:hypothetical protein BH09SUM1_BH09SUM1_18100 [soil metagenome]
MKSSRAFTLIELLVVVAIIAILASIATVNFQYAQARAKVARATADMRTMATALAAYRVDNRAYPMAAVGNGDLMLPNPLQALVSPIAYLSAVPVDPFGEASFDFAPDLHLRGYLYCDRATTNVGLAKETYGIVWRENFAIQYLIHSPGPNRVWDVTPYVDYDPTNGAISRGDVCLRN